MDDVFVVRALVVSFRGLMLYELVVVVTVVNKSEIWRIKRGVDINININVTAVSLSLSLFFSLCGCAL